MYFFSTGHWPVKYFVLKVVLKIVLNMFQVWDLKLTYMIFSSQRDWTETYHLSDYCISQQDEIIMTSSQNWDSMRLGPDVLHLSAKQPPFLLQPLFCWWIGSSFLTVTAVTGMGQLLIQAQSYSEELILVLVCITQPNCIVCQKYVPRKCTC